VGYWVLRGMLELWYFEFWYPSWILKIISDPARTKLPRSKWGQVVLVRWVSLSTEASKGGFPVLARNSCMSTFIQSQCWKVNFN
jgi:hypothetical protein